MALRVLPEGPFFMPCVTDVLPPSSAAAEARFIVFPEGVVTVLRVHP